MNAPASDMLMFRLGPHVYAAAVHDVRRIQSVRALAAEDLVVQSVLGEPAERLRGVVVGCGGEGERTLVVDQVLGVRAVAHADLRPMPAFAAACLSSAAITGFALLEQAPTLLVDLPTLIRERRGGGQGSRAQERPDDG